MKKAFVDSQKEAQNEGDNSSTPIPKDNDNEENQDSLDPQEREISEESSTPKRQAAINGRKAWTTPTRKRKPEKHITFSSVKRVTQGMSEKPPSNVPLSQPLVPERTSSGDKDNTQTQQ
jgi:hypothetical protein